jgi:hypothetical protein
LQGELYTSAIFNTTHQELQAAAGEPGCNLPHVVLALMFWSDGTHLTNFGKAKLWPVYMFFGNESNYRWCKPSEDLCEHIAYFEDVCHYLFFYFFLADRERDFSCLMTSKTSQASTMGQLNKPQNSYNTAIVS